MIGLPPRSTQSRSSAASDVYKRQAGIEVDVRIQLLLDEVRILQRDLLQRHGDLQQRIILHAQAIQNLMTGFLHHGRARVVVLVDPVTKALSLIHISEPTRPY
eukprot:TRINITY_DN29417_c0_g1_i1.p1 TRINITY_DN29417_c0_g1~~TRINITY_DN29417_c0_g1_i1.p1  ORF type:complete len:103 (+),score=40.78 TRINITY_DN29417_c0_g1_i1:134-442(+)